MLDTLVQDASNNILIIDDSNETCSLLVTGIIEGCAQTGRTCRVVQSSAFGMIETIPLNFSNNVFDDKIVNVYTANSPYNALPVLQQPNINRLTIVCDIMLPNDPQVGLPGLLAEITRLQLAVNLVFASSEDQNRHYVEELLNNKKAFFLEKGTISWNQLPYALVEKSDLFHYHQIHSQDYQPRSWRPTSSDSALAGNSSRSGRTSLLSPSEAALEAGADGRPPLKSSTGLLKMLTFWRR